MEKKEFKKFYDELEYFYVSGHKKMTIEEIAEKCREHIRKNGFNCLDDNWNEDGEAEDWIKKNHPEWDTEGFEWYAVLYNALEFLCVDDCDEPCFREIEISFYGNYDKEIGVFNVTTC